MEQQTAILVSSCDAFADCWSPFFHGISKYWPDCPYRVFVVTNTCTHVDDRAEAIRLGRDNGWTENTRQALLRMSFPYIIYTHEDFWVSAPVNTAAIEDYVDLVRRDVADYVRLCPCPGPDAPFAGDDRVGSLDANAPYRTSLQMAVWRKSVLLDLLREGEDPWEFELNGTTRSRRYGERFMSVRRLGPDCPSPGHRGVEYVCTAVNKGRWSREGRAYAVAEELEIDFSKRPFERWWHRTTWFGRWEHLKRRVRKAKRHL